MIAFTRAVPPTLARCELTHLERRPIDVARASAQHALYEEALRALGCEVRRLPPLPEQPDSVFVEDTAVVTDACAVIARPGAGSRRAETSSMAEALRPLRPLRSIAAPGTLDGGDVLRVGGRAWVGLSTRTDAEGARQLAAFLAAFGETVTAVVVGGRLHLKSAVTALDAETLILDPSAVDAGAFAGLRVVEVDPAEPWAANVLALGGRVLCPADAPRTCDRLARAGFPVVAVDNSELARAEGGLTCCSVLVAAR